MLIVLVVKPGFVNSSVAVVTAGAAEPPKAIAALVFPPPPKSLLPVVKSASLLQLEPFQYSVILLIGAGSLDPP